MSVMKLMSCVSKARVAVFAFLASLVAAIAVVPVSAQAHEIVVTIHKVTALDQIDVTPADFYARVMIDGNIHLVRRIAQKNEIEPNWEFRQEVGRRSSRKIDVWIELWDKDLAIDDMIDINERADKPKRHHDIQVRTRRCKIYDLYGAKCGKKITVKGNEKKKAEITFTIDVE